MSVIYEATKKDGTRQLVAPTYFKRFQEAVADAGYKNKMKAFGQMLANACFCRGWARIDQIKYSEGAMKRTTIIWS